MHFRLCANGTTAKLQNVANSNVIELLSSCSTSVRSTGPVLLGHQLTIYQSINLSILSSINLVPLYSLANAGSFIDTMEVKKKDLLQVPLNRCVFSVRLYDFVAFIMQCSLFNSGRKSVGNNTLLFFPTTMKSTEILRLKSVPFHFSASS